MLLGRGRDLQGLVNNLLELHRLESGEVEPEPAATALIELLDGLCRKAAGYLVEDRPVQLVRSYGALPETVLVDGVLFCVGS